MVKLKPYSVSDGMAGLAPPDARDQQQGPGAIDVTGQFRVPTATEEMVNTKFNRTGPGGLPAPLNVKKVRDAINIQHPSLIEEKPNKRMVPIVVPEVHLRHPFSVQVNLAILLLRLTGSESFVLSPHRAGLDSFFRRTRKFLRLHFPELECLSIET